MEAQGRVRIKICCIASLEEARVAVRCGADALGLVSWMPSGPGVIPDERIAEIAAWAPPPVATFLLTCGQEAEEVIALARRAGCSTLQLCDRFRGGYAELRRGLPGVRLVQVVHVCGSESLAEALSVAPEVDALLLDSGRPALPVKELGGTGRVHDWRVSREIVARSPVPVFLAGGLTPENAGEAVRAVRPWGLDVCTGVRTDGVLDAGKVARFIGAACQPPPT